MHPWESRRSKPFEPAWRVRGRGSSQGPEPGRLLAVARRAGDGDVLELLSIQHAAKHEPAAAHVPAPHEVAGKAKAAVEVALDDVHVLSGRDASQEHHAVLSSEDGGQCRGIALERLAESRLVRPAAACAATPSGSATFPKRRQVKAFPWPMRIAKNPHPGSDGPAQEPPPPRSPGRMHEATSADCIRAREMPLGEGREQPSSRPLHPERHNLGWHSKRRSTTWSVVSESHRVSCSAWHFCSVVPGAPGCPRRP